MTTATKTHFAILISTGNSKYRPLVGWDSVYTTRSEAAAAKARADKNDGWFAKVIAMTRDEAIANGWI